MMPNDWVVEAFTKGLNSESLVTSFKLKESLIKFEKMIGDDMNN